MVETTLLVPGRFDRLETITDFVARAARLAGLNESSVYHCELAADEAYSNIIMHAYGGEDRGDIQLTCQCEPGTLTIIFEDHGRPFDSGSIKAPDLSGPLEGLAEGGLGVHLMRQLMDEVKFDPGRDQNRLTLVKRDHSRVP